MRERKIEVKLPPGVEHGSKLRIAGGGEAGLRGGPPGDLYVVISLRPHKLFRREKDNLFYELTLGMADAALGTEVEIPTLDGPPFKGPREPNPAPFSASKATACPGCAAPERATCT